MVPTAVTANLWIFGIGDPLNAIYIGITRNYRNNIPNYLPSTTFNPTLLI